MADEKLCLKWNDFQNIVQTSLGELRRSRDFIDVTLACEDMSINAHKIILSSCSPFFKRLLRAHTNPHPLIFMRGIKSRDLEAIVDFIYLGEANIFQEQLETFLALAEELELEGLSGNPEEVAQENESVHNPNQRKPETGPEKDIRETTLVKNKKTISNTSLMEVRCQTKQATKISPETSATIESLIGGQPGALFCTQCGYKSGKRSNMKEHVEKHIEGLEYPCTSCKKVFRSSLSLRNHKRKD